MLLPLLLSAQLKSSDSILVAAERPGAYLPLLYGKKVAVTANQTSMVNSTHLVDFLIENDVAVKKVFSPEHGFRGTASAGEKVKDGVDTPTGLPIISLYGSNKKPTADQIRDIDVVVFDIQDVGARFYTYISTLSYIMEACAEEGKKVVVLDRPNPHGYYVAGPVLKPGFESFVGMHPIPVVHGLTVGEYAKIVNGEGWLKDGVQCDLEVVRVHGWDHQTEYKLPVKPSPNLPNQQAIILYPSLCFFEGTNVSVGRGTDKPFQQIGAPWFEEGNQVFIPQSTAAAKYPKFEGEECRGYDLSQFANHYLQGKGELYLFWLAESYQSAKDKSKFFSRPEFFDLLAGTDQLRKGIIAGKSVEEMRLEWQDDLDDFKRLRQKYLLYPARF